MKTQVFFGIVVALFFASQVFAGEDSMKRVTIGVAGMMKSQNGIT